MIQQQRIDSGTKINIPLHHFLLNVRDEISADTGPSIVRDMMGLWLLGISSMTEIETYCLCSINPLMCRPTRRWTKRAPAERISWIDRTMTTSHRKTWQRRGASHLTSQLIRCSKRVAIDWHSLSAFDSRQISITNNPPSEGTESMNWTKFEGVERVWVLERSEWRKLTTCDRDTPTSSSFVTTCHQRLCFSTTVPLGSTCHQNGDISLLH